MSDLPTGFRGPPYSDLGVTDDHAPNPATGFWGYMLEEDYGVKNLVSGLFVGDLQDSARPVRVFFENPEKEERATHYPFITLAFLAPRFDTERAHRGHVQISYKYLQDAAYSNTSPIIIDYPIPMMLTYQITTHARNNQHHSQMNAQLSTIIHPQFGVVTCPGGTTRRLVLRSTSAANGIDSDRKRIFRTVWRIEVASEIEPQVAIGTRVEEVLLTVIDERSGASATKTIT